MAGYKTYRFRDKDPVIDLLRTAVQAAATAAGVREAVMYRRVARDTGLSPTTLWNWFRGETRMPRHAGVQAVARLLHKEFRLTDLGSNVVQMRRRRAA